MIIIRPGTKAKKGDRVKLADKKCKYIPNHSNPTIESKYECGGVITEIKLYTTLKGDKKHRNFIVLWDNGIMNGYDEYDLVKDFSELGNINSIW